MDELERLIEAFSGRADSSVLSLRKLDALMDIERLHDPRVVPFLLEVLTDRRQPREVRMQVLKSVRDPGVAEGLRDPVARAILLLVQHQCHPWLRLHAVLALGEFTDISAVPGALGGVALDPHLPLDVRYAAFTSLKRAGATPECVALLRRLLPDDALGACARSLLSSWRIGQIP